MSVLFISETVSAQMGFADDGLLAARGRRPIHTRSSSSAALTAGAFVNSWTEGDIDGILRIYAQVVSPNGQLIFPDDPLALSTGETHASGSEVVATSDGASVICWKEYVEGGNSIDIHIQRLNDRGETEWEEGGRVIHQIRGQSRISYNIFPDFEGGVYLVTKSFRDPQASWIYSIDENGEFREGLPDDGLRMDSTSVGIEPIRGGGCWVLHHDNLANRLLTDGSFRWEESFIREAPEGMRITGTGSDGLNLYCLFERTRDDGYSFAVTVYDTAGQVAASSDLCERETEDLFELSRNFMVAEDGLFYLIISEFFLGGDVVDVREMPWVICYDPFSDNPLLWGEDGVQLPFNDEIDSNYLVAGYATMHRFGETLIIAEDSAPFRPDLYKVYTLNPDGERAWNEQPTVFPVGEEISTYVGRNSYSNGEQIWVFSGIRNRPGCFSISSDGELITGQRPVWLVPGYRYYPGFVCGNVMDNGEYNILGYSQNGLFAQKIGINSGLHYPVDGVTIENRWPMGSRGIESGKIGNRQWLWQYLDNTIGQLAVLDENQTFIFNRRIEFPDGDLNWRTKTIYDCDPDHLLIFRNRRANVYELTSIDLDGEQAASIELNEWVTHIDYLENHGLVVVSGSDGITNISLLNDQLQDIWDERVELTGFGSRSHPTCCIYEQDGHLKLVRLRFDDDSGLYWDLTATITSDGEFLSEDSLQVFSEPNNRALSEWQSYQVSNGTVWFFGSADNNYNLIQGIDGNGQRLLGDEGLRIQRNARFLPDQEGGCWLAWEDFDSVRVTHLDAHGQPWQRAFPEDGFALYDGEEYTIYSADFDPESGRLWISIEREYRVHGNDMPLEFRVQVVGDEWVSAPIENLTTHPKSFILNPAYPNPFNSTTTITYGLPFPGNVSLQVYNPLGQRISTIFEGNRQAGIYSTNLAGKDLASGLYFVRLEGAGQVFTRKVMLVR